VDALLSRPADPHRRHADERGTRDYNLALASLRATSVRNYLISLDIPAQRRAAASHGKERPRIAGSSEEPWSQYRRAAAEVDWERPGARDWLAIRRMPDGTHRLPDIPGVFLT
jgi:hypothetical protein